ncbi:CAZyme family GH3 [Aspergillus niger]|uniref:beta-glucosidase n=2 Tax=Aspergillus niger TaxID=5061 RepID=A0A254U5K0_ASPNG|nr:CAZyme family GH3 [Aspergillus niger]KAI2880119.1 CAZyme family GH3 [Aspergillus niger]KAI2892448.1 CAZyme family GH3 [Aspergillus niger]KAI2954549.1 CAZyme family GH3 [Aspergillus niger]KAI2974097.1 CAZyme family GH3 [Aspergillus niger]
MAIIPPELDHFYASNMDLEVILRSLTLPEKVTLLAGASTWRTAPVPRVNIPHLKLSDGPSGARGEIFGDSVPAAFFPSGTSLGATWDEDLLGELGQILAEECKSKSASVILGPTMCIHRHPLGGRNFESYSEDPYLTGRLATATIRGIQSRGIGATAKHYVANDQETDRFHYNAVIPTRALREVYLRPFQMVVRDANPWCLMTAYNRVNGAHCDENVELLTDILRKEWGWEGVAMSDWGGAHDAAQSLVAGLDLEMPGPPVRRTWEIVQQYLADSKITEADVDRSVHRILRLLKRTKRFENDSEHPETTLRNSNNTARLLHAAQSGIVLLKNEAGCLPLWPSEGLERVGIFGPNSARVVAGGGGSSYIKAPYWTNVDDSLTARFQDTTTEIVRNVGAKVNRYLPAITLAATRNPDTGGQGAAIDWFSGHDLSGQPTETIHTDDLYYINFGNTPQTIATETGFSFRLRTTIVPLTTGTHRLSLASIGPSKLYISGQLMAHQDGNFEKRGTLFFTYGSHEAIFTLDMVAGQEYHVEIEYWSHDRQLSAELLPRMDPMEDKFQGVRLGYEEANRRDLPSEAAKQARDCEAAVVVVGRDREWETEGQDVPMFALPGEQVRLIEEVAAVCARTIVVIQSGTPVQLEPWIENVKGVVCAWYQGQELGNATASVVCGEFNPSGRLPMTWPRRLEECPAFSSFRVEAHEIQYAEGIYVGGRWWDLLGTQPMYPLGYGLSYNTFALRIVHPEQLAMVTGPQPVQVIVEVTHRGDGAVGLPGRETVIAWCEVVDSGNGRLARPPKQVSAFAKSPLLAPGETCTVSLSITAYELGVYDPERQKWVLDKGAQFRILVGADAAHTQKAGTIHVPETITWVHRLD